MAKLTDGETAEVAGSGKKPYVLRNIGGVYDCSCVAWKMQSHPIDLRTCKHLVAYLGGDEELARVGYDQMPTAWKKKNPRAGTASKPAARRATKRKAPQPVEAEAPELLLAHSWDNDQDVTGWWISEKLDGVRAKWTGSQFISRLGNVYHAPDWFTKGLPVFALDGELFIGRGKFQETVSVVRRKNGGEQWKKVRYLVFDAPDSPGPVEDRWLVARAATILPPYAEYVEQVVCRGVGHLRKELARVEKEGGEGLMLRQPGSRYESCRSSTLLKVKSFFDAEATVIGHTSGRGRHKGRCGALKVRAADGTEFKIGTGLSDAQRQSPPKIGSVVCYRYQELTKAGVPRFPSFVGVRHDVKV